MKLIKKLAAVIFLLLATSQLHAQVNLQTGSGVYSLPMFNWQDNESRLNSVVALDYSSGNGLKVNEVASNEGQGWSLVAGGVISRMQEGIPDDQKPYYNGSTEQDNDLTKYPAGYLYAPVSAYEGCPDALTQYPIYKPKNQLYRQHNITEEDRELDYFSFQFNGKSGMFVIDTADGGTGWSLGDTKMKISFQTDPSMATGDTNGIRTTITSFTIQDVDGLLYKFTIHGLTKVLEQDFCNRNAATPQRQPKFRNQWVYFQSGFVNPNEKNPWVIDNWYLSEIDDPLTGRKIHFNYTTLNLNDQAGQQITYNKGKNEYAIVSFRKSVTKTPEIDSIIYPDGHSVTFNYNHTKPRVDLPGEYPLASIDIKYQGRYLSEYQLKTSYFILNRYGTPVSAYEKSVARLCLRSVRKIGVDLKDQAPPYLFDYYLGSGDDDFVPPPFFYAHDIWGYYNGNASKGYAGLSIPLNTDIRRLSCNQIKGLCFLRENTSSPMLNPKAGYAKNGLLKQIIYPTGGTLSYTYSQNTGTYPDGTADTLVDGVHVSETSATDGGYQYGCANPLVTHYNYTLASGASSLWGLERPVNVMGMHTHYAPEGAGFRIHWGVPECYWRYTYPGILSQYQATSLSLLLNVMNTVTNVLGIVGVITDAMDVITLASTSTGLGYVIMDVIATVVDIVLTCFGDNSHGYDNTVYYDLDLNSMSPLPEQFKQVEIDQGDGGGGKTVQTFTSADDYPLWVPAGDDTAHTPEQRFAPWAYGLPKLTSVYDMNGHLVNQTENVYDTTYARELIEQGSPKYFCFDHPDACEGTGLQTLLISCNCEVIRTDSKRITNWSKKSQTKGDGGYDDSAAYYNNIHPAPADLMKVDFYGMYSGRTQLVTTYKRVYRQTDPSQFMQTETNYFYNKSDHDNFNYEVNEIITRQSNGDVNDRHIKYDNDYTGGVINTLVQNNILSLPIESTTSLVKSGGSTTQYLDEQVTEFEQLPNGDIKPYRVLEQRFPKPSVNPSYYGGPGSNISGYKITRVFTYDAHSNVTGEQDEGLRQAAKIYGYNDKFEIASIINADPLTDKPAYTSFEDGGLGGWTLQGSPIYVTTAAITGARSLALSSGKSLTAPLNTANPYVLSFWATQGLSVSGGASLKKSVPTYNGFTYYEYSISQGASTITVTGTGDIDELRLYPQKARMSSTTYDPLIGKTSQCDENNRITYYEYDNLGRLQFVKDEQKKIVKMYEYNNVSAAKQNGCPSTYYNQAISEVFTRNNCGVNTLPDSNLYTYAIPANKYSSTISQEDADAQAETELLTNGQTQANAHSLCIAVYHNHAISVTDTSQSCDTGYIGGAVTYTVPAGQYSSLISQADADAQAQEEVDDNVWTYVNDPVHRACTVSTAATWEELESDTAQEYCNSSSGDLMVWMTDLNPNSSTHNQKHWFDVGPQDKCPVPTFTVYINNATDIDYDVVLTNTTTGDEYDFGPGAGQQISGNIAQGTYNILLTPGYATAIMTYYTAGCGYYTNGPEGSKIHFYNVPLISGCNTIGFSY